MSDSTENLEITPQEEDNSLQDTVSHFWVSTFPFFQSSLCVLPSTSEARPTELHMSIFDPDGELVNECSFVEAERKVTVIDFDQFLAGCKLVDGYKHAHVLVRSNPGTAHYCRLFTGEGTSYLYTPLEVMDGKSQFFPLTFAEDRESLLIAVNYHEAPVKLKVRMFQGKRKPETYLTIPARGVRLLGVEVSFAEYIDIEQEQSLQGYLRLATRSRVPVGVQILERTARSKEVGVYASVA